MIAKTQPLLVAWLTTVIVTAAARYAPGIRLSDEQALYLAGALFTAGTWAAHRLVTPTARPQLTKTVPLVPGNPEQLQLNSASSIHPPPSNPFFDPPRLQPKQQPESGQPSGSPTTWQPPGSGPPG